MKNLSKTIRTVVIAVIVLIVVVGVLFSMFGNAAIKGAVEKVATSTLGVEVTIDDLDLSILGGSVSFDDLIIDNPEGYEHDSFLELGKAHIDVAIGSLLSDKVSINTLQLDGITLVLEQKGLSSNLQTIMKNLPKSEEEAAAKEGGKDLEIKTLEITNLTVKTNLPIPGKSDTIVLKLSDIKMQDLGTDSKMDVAVLTSKILGAIATGIAQEGTGLLPKSITGPIGDELEKLKNIDFGGTVEKSKELLQGGTEAGKEAIESTKEAGKEITEGLKGLFK